MGCERELAAHERRLSRHQAWVSALLNDLRKGPYWKDSVVLITYD